MKKIFTCFFIFLIVLAISFFIFLKSNCSPLSTDSKNRIFIINSGDSILTISQNLAKNKFIKNRYAFLTYVFLTGKNKTIQSGTFRFSPSLSVAEIVKKLSSGGVSDYWLKIPDGSRIEEIASLFSSDVSFTSQDFLQKVKTKEGYLFPDSYLIPQYFNLDQVLDVIYQNFDQKLIQAKENSISKLSDQKNLILASLLEREGKSLESKKMIAGIILNRLNIGMPLQIDATVLYARDSQSKNIINYWKLPITKSDLSIISPYNTYKNPGLPPKPICNPGYNSLFAAYHPTDSDYLYYITGNDGKMYYAKTLSEHNLNISKYLK